MANGGSLKSVLPVKLAYIIPSLDAGGAEKFACTFCGQIDRKRFKVTLIVLGSQTSANNFGDLSGCDVVFLGCASFRAALPSLLKLLRQVKPEIVVSGISYLIIGLVLIRCFFFLKFKLVSRETSILSLNNRLYHHPMIWNAAYKRTLPFIDLVICQTETMRDDLCSNFALDARKVVVIGNPINIDHVRRLGRMERAGIDPEESRSDGLTSKAMKFVFVGGLRPEKNVGDLINALANVEFEFALDIIGSGPQEEDLRRAVKIRGLQKRIRFLGQKTNPYPYINAADALLISSKYEGFPNVVLEALALQTPVLSTSAGGTMVELASQLNGCFVSKDDTVDAFSSLLTDWFSGRKSMISPTACAAFDDVEIIRTYESSISSLIT